MSHTEAMKRRACWAAARIAGLAYGSAWTCAIQCACARIHPERFIPSKPAIERTASGRQRVQRKRRTSRGGERRKRRGGRGRGAGADLEEARKAKVCDLCSPLPIDKDVLRLEIAVDDWRLAPM